jgi:hypothetical protein
VGKQVKTNEIERRTRLISLANEVLSHMETPLEETSELEMLFLLSQAFFEAVEADAPKEWEGTFMFSKPADVLH